MVCLGIGMSNPHSYLLSSDAFLSRSNTASLVVGVPGAVYFRSATRAATEAAFAAALDDGAVHVIV